MATNLCASLEPYKIAVICVAVAAVVLAMIVAPLAIVKSRKRKTHDDRIIDSRSRINANVQLIEVLLVLAEGKEDVISLLNALQDKIKYLTPTESEKACAIDDKIGFALRDARTELEKTKGTASCGRAKKCIEEAQLLIAERSVYTQR